MLIREYLTPKQKQTYSKYSVDQQMRKFLDHFFGSGVDEIIEPLSKIEKETPYSSRVRRNISLDLGLEILPEQYLDGKLPKPGQPNQLLSIARELNNKITVLEKLVSLGSAEQPANANIDRTTVIKAVDRLFGQRPDINDVKAVQKYIAYVKTLVHYYITDPQRQRVDGNAQYRARIVRGTEVAGQTNAEHSWAGASCKNIESGCNKHYLPHEIRAGTVVMFVLDGQDREIYRATLHPYLPKSKKNDAKSGVTHVVYNLDAEYGNKAAMFTNYAKSVADRLSKMDTDDNTVYAVAPKVYVDSSKRTISSPSSRIKDLFNDINKSGGGTSSLAYYINELSEFSDMVFDQPVIDQLMTIIDGGSLAAKLRAVAVIIGNQWVNDEVKRAAVKQIPNDKVSGIQYHVNKLPVDVVWELVDKLPQRQSLEVCIGYLGGDRIDSGLLQHIVDRFANVDEDEWHFWNNLVAALPLRLIKSVLFDSKFNDKVIRRAILGDNYYKVPWQDSKKYQILKEYYQSQDDEWSNSARKRAKNLLQKFCVVTRDSEIAKTLLEDDRGVDLYQAVITASAADIKSTFGSLMSRVIEIALNRYQRDADLGWLGGDLIRNLLRKNLFTREQWTRIIDSAVKDTRFLLDIVLTNSDSNELSDIQIYNLTHAALERFTSNRINDRGNYRNAIEKNLSNLDLHWVESLAKYTKIKSKVAANMLKAAINEKNKGAQ